MNPIPPGHHPILSPHPLSFPILPSTETGGLKRTPSNSYNRTHGIGRISGTPPSDGAMMTLFSPVAAALSAWRPSYER